MRFFSSRPILTGVVMMSLAWFALMPTAFVWSRTKPSLHPVYRAPVPVPAPTKMREWKYIVIHHSGSSVGNEDIIEEGHLKRGMENGMAYHFLIGNGSAHLGDGEITIGHRWKYQLHGGHSHQDYLNDYGIGICLVGNITRKKPTAKQMQSLAELVSKLQTQFNIQDDNIHGHGEFFGEDTDCPGTLFPWKDFWTTMNVVYENQGTNVVQQVNIATVQ